MQTPSLLTQPRDLSLGSSFYNYELPLLVQKIKNDCSWKMGDLKSIVVMNEPDKKVIVTALHAQSEIESRMTGECIVFHVVEGSLKLKMRKDFTTISAGQKFTLYDKIKYKIEALSESIFLLVLYSKITS